MSFLVLRRRATVCGSPAARIGRTRGARSRRMMQLAGHNAPRHAPMSPRSRRGCLPRHAPSVRHITVSAHALSYTGSREVKTRHSLTMACMMTFERIPSVPWVTTVAGSGATPTL